MYVAAIIAAGGRGERLGAGRPKQLIEIAGQPMLQRSAQLLAAHPEVTEIVVVLPPDLVGRPPNYLLTLGKPVRIVEGGRRRQDSVANGFDVVQERADIILIHDAARPFASADLISRTIAAAVETGAALAALPASDTVKLASGETPPQGPLVERTIPRDRVYLAQTPQAFRTDVLRAAIAAGRAGVLATDEAALAEAAGYPVRLVMGDATNLKITTMDDLTVARALTERRGAVAGIRIGAGYDLHRLVEGRLLILGGVTIPAERGLAGHSDADVLSHALTDAVLGAVAMGDIGRHFPDTDPQWKGASSLAMLAHAVALARGAGYLVSNVDAVVIAEHPRLSPHIDEIRESLATVLGVEVSRVSVKGKTNEGVGEIGRGEAMAVHAVAVLVEQRVKET
ncbi:MAG: 2-C-methyl-D-erythritol 4-phosphate cytidylyltransferase [Acidobacteria bacterium]|nr:2-C-methyl-D-erythritol 4-phosphate cytidylyltransferase [Acidobacteriota bacterium]